MDEVDFRQYLIRITFINWLVNLFIRNPELFTNRDLMDELAELMWSDTCALDGCDNSLLGYMVTAFFCCPKHATKAYRQSPEYKANMKAYDKARAQTPERKASQKAIMKAYNQTPQRKASNKAYNKAYKQTSEYKAYQKVYNKAYYARKKAEAKLLTPS